MLDYSEFKYFSENENLCDDEIGVHSLKFPPKPEGIKTPSIISIQNEYVIFKKGYIEIGCETIKNDIVREICFNLIDQLEGRENFIYL